MAKPVLIGPNRGSTPVDLATTGSAAHALPDDLLRDASRRLGIMALLGAALWTIGTLLDHLIETPWSQVGLPDVISIASVVSCLLLYWYTRRHQRDPRFVLDLGLGYMIVTAIALGLNFHWYPAPSGVPVFPMFTWVGPVLLMFAAIVPNAPKKVFVASLIAASMNPMGMLIARARGTWDFGSASNVLVMHYPDYILVGVAVIISHVVTKLGQQVAKARELGSYRLGALLGRGGMGEVYHATHRMLARPAAVKLIRPEMLAAEDDEAARLAIRRFRREAEAAANLRSPHTVELYDFGVTENDTLYFVMELLDGMNLEVLVREHGEQPAARVIHILRQVCESLEEAHANGLVHRDIKPANIHLGRLGLRHDFVKVLDFGLVKTVRDMSDGQSLATAQGMTPGTPAYMAPELAFGEKIDGRADLYALGCVAYYLLTGQLVFEAESTMQMLGKHLRAAPPAPSRRAMQLVPSALDAVVLSCLAKDPAGRPESAHALDEMLAHALDEMLARIDVEPWGEEQARQWWNSRGAAVKAETLAGSSPVSAPFSVL